MACARCDQLEAQVAELRDALLGTLPLGRLRELGFTRSQMTILRLMVNRARCSRDAIAAVLYSGRSEADRPESADLSSGIIDMHVMKLRKKLREHFKIEIKTVWGLGWYIEEADREFLRDLMKEPV